MCMWLHETLQLRKGMSGEKKATLAFFRAIQLILLMQRVIGIVYLLVLNVLISCKPLHSHLALSGGTLATKSELFDSRKGSSFALEPEAIIEFGVKTKDEDAGSIKEDGDLDMKLNVSNENDENGKDNECKESSAGAVPALEMCAVTTGALEETEEVVKGDTTVSHPGQRDEENEASAIECAAGISNEQSGTYDDDGVKVTAC